MQTEHYAVRYRRFIERQAKTIDVYYKAIRKIKQLAGHPDGKLHSVGVDLSNFPDIEGDEECPIINDAKTLKQLIQNLPEII